MSDKTKKYISEGLWIAFLPAAGYWFAFIFFRSFYAHYNIPSSFIQIGISEILISISVAVFFLFVLNIAVWILGHITHSWPRALKSSLIRILPVSILALFIALSGEKSLSDRILIILLLCVFPMAMQLLLPLRYARGVKGYINKLEAVNKADDADNTPLEAVVERLPFHISLPVVLFILLTWFFWVSGDICAMYKKTYVISEPPEEMVILCSNNKHHIMAPVDMDTKSIKYPYVLRDRDLDSLKFSVRKIGPLTAPSVSNNEKNGAGKKEKANNIGIVE